MESWSLALFEEDHFQDQDQQKSHSMTKNVTSQNSFTVELQELLTLCRYIYATVNLSTSQLKIESSQSLT